MSAKNFYHCYAGDKRIGIGYQVDFLRLNIPTGAMLNILMLLSKRRLVIIANMFLKMACSGAAVGSKRGLFLNIFHFRIFLSAGSLAKLELDRRKHWSYNLTSSSQHHLLNSFYTLHYSEDQ